MDSLVEPLETLLADFKEKWREVKGPEEIWDSVAAFVRSVDWTVSGLFCFPKDCDRKHVELSLFC